MEMKMAKKNGPVRVTKDRVTRSKRRRPVKGRVEIRTRKASGDNP